MQRGFSKAHEYISRGKNEAQNCGTAQLLGGNYSENLNINIFFSFLSTTQKNSNPKKSNYKENLMDVIDWSNLFV